MGTGCQRMTAMLVKSLFTYWTGQLFAPGSLLKAKYEAFKVLLEHDKRAHELMAGLEEIHHQRVKVDFSVVESLYDELAFCVGHIVDSLLHMAPTRYSTLKTYFNKFDGYIRFMLSEPDHDFSPPFTLLLPELNGSRMKGYRSAGKSIIKIHFFECFFGRYHGFHPFLRPQGFHDGINQFFGLIRVGGQDA